MQGIFSILKQKSSSQNFNLAFKKSPVYKMNVWHLDDFYPDEISPNKVTFSFLFEVKYYYMNNY